MIWERESRHMASKESGIVCDRGWRTRKVGEKEEEVGGSSGELPRS